LATATGGIPPTILHQIRDSVDIVEVVSQYVTLSKTGQNFKGLCPFHAEKTPSFSVNSPKQMFYCFGCGAGGDVFTFLIQKEGLTFVEAVKELAERAHITIPADTRRSPASDLGDHRKILEDLHRTAREWFQRNLFDSAVGTSALEYLERAFIHMSSRPNVLLTAGRSLSIACANLGDKASAIRTIQQTMEIGQIESKKAESAHHDGHLQVGPKGITGRSSGGPRRWYPTTPTECIRTPTPSYRVGCVMMSLLHQPQ